MGKFGIQLLLSDNTWNTRCNVPKKIVLLIHQLNGL